MPVMAARQRERDRTCIDDRLKTVIGHSVLTSFFEYPGGFAPEWCILGAWVFGAYTAN